MARFLLGLLLGFAFSAGARDAVVRDPLTDPDVACIQACGIGARTVTVQDIVLWRRILAGIDP